MNNKINKKSPVKGGLTSLITKALPALKTFATANPTLTAGLIIGGVYLANKNKRKNQQQQNSLSAAQEEFDAQLQQYKNSKAYASKENKSVDLYLSGKMFSSLTWKVSGSKGSLFFRRQTENIKAFKHDQGIGKLPKRPFFAIGKQDENKIRDLFFKHIKV